MTSSTSPPGALGISDTNRPRDWAPLTGTETTQVLTAFGLKPVTPPLWQSQRPFSAGALVEAQKSDGATCSVFIKRHDSALRTVKRLETEHAFMRHLSQHGVATPQALFLNTSLPKGSAWQNGRNVYEVFSTFKGVDLYRDVVSWARYHSVIQAKAAGTALAQLHKASAGFAQPDGNVPLMSGDCALLEKTLETGLERWIPTQHGLEESLERLGLDGGKWQKEALPLLLPFHKRLLTQLNGLAALWGHGDWHGSNLSWTKDGASVCEVFDFGLSGYTSAPFDLAVAIERSFVQWMNMNATTPIAWEQLQAFLEAYDALRPRSAQERFLTGAFLPLVHVQFAFSEIAYYAALLNDLPAARIAWESYLLGHTRWFGSPQGQALIETASQ